MNPNEEQNIIDDATSVYDLGEGTDAFNKKKKEQSEIIKRHVAHIMHIFTFLRVFFFV